MNPHDFRPGSVRDVQVIRRLGEMPWAAEPRTIDLRAVVFGLVLSTPLAAVIYGFLWVTP